MPVIVGVGIDLVVVDRIKAIRERHDEKFLSRVFTRAEVDGCMERKDPDQGLAARFAAKEAALKAFGTGLASGMSWQDIEIITGDDGSPSLRFEGEAKALAEKLGITRSWVSLTHDGPSAAAVVVLEK